MAIVETASTPITLTNLYTRLRRALGDEETSPSNQRWNDLALLDAVNMEMIKIQTATGLRGSGAQEVSVNLTYTAESDSVALPAGALSQPITRVEDMADTTRPQVLTPVSAQGVGDGHNGPVWAIRGSTIVVRPNTQRTLRIWYIRPPLVYALSGTDQHSLPMAAEELISLGASIRLQEVDDEVPPGRRERYAELWLLMLAAAKKVRGPKSVRNDRRFQ